MLFTDFIFFWECKWERKPDTLFFVCFVIFGVIKFESLIPGSQESSSCFLLHLGRRLLLGERDLTWSHSVYYWTRYRGPVMSDASLLCSAWIAQTETKILHIPGEGASSLKSLFAWYKIGVIFASGLFWANYSYVWKVLWDPPLEIELDRNHLPYCCH